MRLPLTRVVVVAITTIAVLLGVWIQGAAPSSSSLFDGLSNAGLDALPIVAAGLVVALVGWLLVGWEAERLHAEAKSVGPSRSRALVAVPSDGDRAEGDEAPDEVPDEPPDARDEAPDAPPAPTPMAVVSRIVTGDHQVADPLATTSDEYRAMPDLGDTDLNRPPSGFERGGDHSSMPELPRPSDWNTRPGTVLPTLPDADHTDTPDEVPDATAAAEQAESAPTDGQAEPEPESSEGEFAKKEETAPRWSGSFDPATQQGLPIMANLSTQELQSVPVDDDGLPFPHPGTPNYKENPADAAYRFLFEKFMAARKRCGQTVAGISFEAFRRKLLQQEEAVKADNADAKLQFEVFVNEGKASVRVVAVDS